jgi:hypothetical protein
VVAIGHQRNYQNEAEGNCTYVYSPPNDHIIKARQGSDRGPYFDTQSIFVHDPILSCCALHFKVSVVSCRACHPILAASHLRRRAKKHNSQHRCEIVVDKKLGVCYCLCRWWEEGLFEIKTGECELRNPCEVPRWLKYPETSILRKCLKSRIVPGGPATSRRKYGGWLKHRTPNIERRTLK